MTSGRRFGPDIFRYVFLADIIGLKTAARAVFRFGRPPVRRIRAPGHPPTEGCVAISPRDMARLPPHLSVRTVLRISR